MSDPETHPSQQPTEQPSRRSTEQQDTRATPARTTRPIRVVVADDHPMWRDAVARDLADAGFEVVATADDGHAAVNRTRATRPDVLVLDLNLPGLAGHAVCEQLAALEVPTRILILSASGEQRDVLEAVKAGALGYLVKSADRQEFLDAVRATAAGEPVFTPGLAGLVLGEFRRAQAAPPDADSRPIPELTERETEILKYVATGMGYKEIAAVLFLSHRTVQNHVQNIFGKLQMHNRVELVRFAFERGLDPADPRDATDLPDSADPTHASEVTDLTRAPDGRGWDPEARTPRTHPAPPREPAERHKGSSFVLAIRTQASTHWDATYPCRVTTSTASPTGSPIGEPAMAALNAAATELPAAQQPDWPDTAALAQVSETLQSYPPLVFAGECDILTERMAAAARGEAFVLQGGDCAETFVSATADNIRDRIKTILQMAAVLTYGASVPVVKVGRMAGQYAKPRSSNVETREGVTLPAYRGDMVNDFTFHESARTPDPNRLVQAYHASSATLNLVRAFTTGGFADLRYVHEWNRGFVASSANARYERLARDIDKAMRFMQACGADFDAMRTVEFFAAHEALVLDYERPLTRIDSRSGRLYDTSGHFVWVGERTRQLEGAHIDFVSRISNPVGVKLGPKADTDEVLRIIDRIDPDRTPGRLTFITRMGAGTIREVLPALVDKVTASGAVVTWICDPMHGNTFSSANGFKTRNFDDIVEEVRGFFEVHRSLGTVPGGIHVELTGNDVTECLGGTAQIIDTDLEKRYESVCDPRLNHKQSLELAFVVAEMLGQA